MRTLFVFAILTTSLCFAKQARTLHMTNKKMEQVFVPVGKTTILSFPTRPTKVIVGNQGLFGVEYVEQDLAVSALRAGAHSNLFVYLEGRRFGFDLRASSDSGDEIILVRDAEEKRLKVRVRQ